MLSRTTLSVSVLVVLLGCSKKESDKVEPAQTQQVDSLKAQDKDLQKKRWKPPIVALEISDNGDKRCIELHSGSTEGGGVGISNKQYAVAMMREALIWNSAARDKSAYVKRTLPSSKMLKYDKAYNVSQAEYQAIIEKEQGTLVDETTKQWIADLYSDAWPPTDWQAPIKMGVLTMVRNCAPLKEPKTVGYCRHEAHSEWSNVYTYVFHYSNKTTKDGQENCRDANGEWFTRAPEDWASPHSVET
jgi:hypothetical protein